MRLMGCCCISLVAVSLFLPGRGHGQEVRQAERQVIREGSDHTKKFSNQTRAVAFAFGDREDVLVWAEGVASITGSKDVLVIQNQFPTMEELVELFNQEPEWLFLGGHFNGWMFTNGIIEYDAEVESVPIQIYFYRESVVINRGKERRVLTKGKDFRLHENLKYIFWGGCSAHHRDDRTRTILSVFSNTESRPVSFGWDGVMGYEITHAMMGGYGNEPPFASEDFFDRLEAAQSKSPLTDRQVIESWMRSSIDTYWGEAYPINDRVSVIDSYGDEWVIERGEIVKSVRPWSDLSFAGDNEREAIRKRQREQMDSPTPDVSKEASTEKSRPEGESSP
ncbi:MAG: hypothetical protein AAF911_10965 [Planctomycetota bacterium]